MEKPIESFGLWLEQLLAESTGKEGRGLLPVANEPVGKPNVYGNDRLFIHISLNNQTDELLSQAIQQLQEAGRPIVKFHLSDLLDLGQEFFRWEMAVAVAGSMLGINAFDQPNVQESKDNTRRLLSEIIEGENLPQEAPILSEGMLSLYSRLDSLQQVSTMAEAFEHWLSMGYPGYYIALMAFLPEFPETEKMLQALRQNLRDKQRLATTLGYGPRFLHSTGQYHKVGPNTGLFLQLTVQDKLYIPIPGYGYDFGMFKQAEALGDIQALQRHERRVLRIDLGEDAIQGLTQLRNVVDQVMFSRIS